MNFKNLRKTAHRKSKMCYNEREFPKKPSGKLY